MSLIHFKTKYGNDPDFGSNERVFVEQYDWMIQSATNLTRGQRERAEDLVHDAFVQFQVKQQNLGETAIGSFQRGGLMPELWPFSLIGQLVAPCRRSFA